jgi:hypothetical protein
MMWNRRAALAGMIAGLAAIAAPVGAGETGASPGRWHISAAIEGGGAAGGYGDFLEKPIALDLALNHASASGRWRLGGGFRFGSLAMKAPYQDQKEWAHFETYAAMTRVFRAERSFRPYLQLRLGAVRIHPRSEIFYVPGWEELPVGDSPTKPVNGVGLTLRPGFEIDITRSLSLDVSGFWNAYKTGQYDLAPIGKPPVDSGQEFGAGLGLVWRPLAGPPPPPRPQPQLDPATALLLPLPAETKHRDGWGVRRSWGWAAGEVLAINFTASMFNEYVRNANFNQISPRSFRHNFEEGFTYDDNQFKTNQYWHPWNGSAYFNAARGNGLSFWPSAAASFGGAFIWECCGETHPMSFNDQVATGIGGIAFGETMYRLSSMVLDNTKTGAGRVFRETVALFLDPIREVNRMITGDAWRVQGNPKDPFDRRPPNLTTALLLGGRVIGEGESISENTKSYGLAQLDVLYGSPFFNERRRPFDRFDTSLQWNFGDKTRLGRLQIRGDLFSGTLGSGKKHAIALTQDFDYVNNEAYEYGAQSLGLSLYSRFTPSANTTVVSRLALYGTILGAVNTNCIEGPEGEEICRSALADVADKERFREYDYGPGLGAGVEVVAGYKGRPFLSGSYRFTRLRVTNGSIYSDDTYGGLDANHDVHRAGLRLSVPVHGRLGIGAEGFLFLRKSRYDPDPSLVAAIQAQRPELMPLVEDVDQRNPELRVFFIWSFVRGASGAASQ